MTVWQVFGLGMVAGVLATVGLGVVLSALHELLGGPNP